MFVQTDHWVEHWISIAAAQIQPDLLYEHIKRLIGYGHEVEHGGFSFFSYAYPSFLHQYKHADSLYYQLSLQFSTKVETINYHYTLIFHVIMYELTLSIVLPTLETVL